MGGREYLFKCRRENELAGSIPTDEVVILEDIGRENVEEQVSWR